MKKTEIIKILEANLTADIKEYICKELEFVLPEKLKEEEINTVLNFFAPFYKIKKGKVGTNDLNFEILLKNHFQRI